MLVPWGVDEPRATPAEVERVRATYHLHQPYVMWAGTIEPRKNLPTLLDAFRRLDRHGLDLVLVGPRGWNEDLERHVGSADGRVRQLGFVPEADKRALLAGASVFCLPSLQEGFGLPVLEAMAQGVAVITSRTRRPGRWPATPPCWSTPGMPRRWPRRWPPCSTIPPGPSRWVGRRGPRRRVPVEPHRRAARPGLPPGVPMSAPASGDSSRPRLGANLLWLVPGVVGGSEEYTVRLLDSFARVAGGTTDLTLFVNRSFPAAHPQLVATYPTVVAPIDGPNKAARVAAEAAWLSRRARAEGVELLHHMGGNMLRGRPPGIVTIHDLQPFAHPEHFSHLKRAYLGRDRALGPAPGRAGGHPHRARP